MGMSDNLKELILALVLVSFGSIVFCSYMIHEKRKDKKEEKVSKGLIGVLVISIVIFISSIILSFRK